MLTAVTSILLPTVFYCNEEKGTNHAVTVVGWDDDYAASNFSVTPEGNGAWLVRNTWSAGSDVDNLSYYTYFWLSYYDKSLSGSAYAFDFEPADNYDHNYQYDGAMFGFPWCRRFCCESIRPVTFPPSSKVVPGTASVGVFTVFHPANS